MSQFKLTIPTPCHESWEGMMPNGQGRFCGSCQKTVTDFTAMNDAQISAYMLLRANKNICGRFKSSQLERIVIQVPAKVLYAQTSFRKIFMLALLVTMGTTLFSCTDDFGSKQPIEQVIVTDTTVTTDGEEIVVPPPPDGNHVMGALAVYELDTLNALSAMPPPEVYPGPKSTVNGKD
jgi:hypothetical protein